MIKLLTLGLGELRSPDAIKLNTHLWGWYVHRAKTFSILDFLSGVWHMRDSFEGDKVK